MGAGGQEYTGDTHQGEEGVRGGTYMQNITLRNIVVLVISRMEANIKYNLFLFRSLKSIDV